MKRIISLFAVAVIAVLAAAEAEAGRFGVKGTANLAGTDFKTSPAIGYEFGFTWQINLPLGFAIQPDLLYSVNGTTAEALQDNIGVGYLKLPVNVQLGPRFAHRNLRLFVQASPYIGYAVSKQAGTSWDDMNRFSYGAGLGAGVQLWCFQLTAQYNWNLGALENVSNTSLEDFDKSKINGASVSLALMFGKRKK